MKALQFRAWDGESMNYGGFNIHATGKPCIEFPTIACREDELKVMQFTGIKDNLGKDIYEGDVVEWGDDVFELVIFEGGSFCTESSMLCGTTMQVIGNIYETPELNPHK